MQSQKFESTSQSAPFLAYLGQMSGRGVVMAGFGGTVMAGLVLGAIASAQAASLTQWRYDPTANQLELTVKDGTTPRYFLMAQPARIVVDLPDTSVGEVMTQETYSGAVRSIRVSQFKPGLARIVIELSPDVSLAPGQVKLEKASGNSRWILQPLIAGATSKPPLARTSPVPPPKNTSAVISPKPSPSTHSAKPTPPPVSPTTAHSPHPTSISTTPSPAASTVVPAIPLTNSTSTALFPPPSVNTNNAAIRRPSSVVKTPGSQTHPQASQKPSPASKPSANHQAPTNESEDGFAANAAGIAIAVPPPNSTPSPLTANSAAPPATNASAPLDISTTLDIPTTIVSVPPDTAPTITVPPLPPLETAPAEQTPFPPSAAPQILPQPAQSAPSIPLDVPSFTPDVPSRPAIVAPSATNDLPSSVVPLTPPTVSVPQLSPSLPPTVSSPLPTGTYPPAFNVPPLSTPSSAAINFPGPQPGMPSSSVFRQNPDNAPSLNSSGIANPPQIIEFGQPLPTGLTNP